MNKELLKEFWEDTIKMLKEAVRLTKAANLTNELDMLDYIDEANKITVEF